MAAFERGDVVSVPLDPVLGHEQRGTRPALVLTTKAFNRLGDVLVAPITQGGDFARYAGFAVTLTGTGCLTQGVALVNKIRMLDFKGEMIEHFAAYEVPLSIKDGLCDIHLI